MKQATGNIKSLALKVLEFRQSNLTFITMKRGEIRMKATGNRQRACIKFNSIQI
jgi:hypothetical protein